MIHFSTMYKTKQEVMKMEVVRCGKTNCEGIVCFDEDTKSFVCDTCGALHE